MTDNESRLAEACADVADILMCDEDNDNPCTEPTKGVAREDYCNPCTARAYLWDALDETGHDRLPAMLRAMLDVFKKEDK